MKNKVVLSYRLPWSAVPGGGAWAGLEVALLHVGWLVQYVTIVVIEPLAVRPLANHQASFPSTTTSLGTLMQKNKNQQSEQFLQLTCSKTIQTTSKTKINLSTSYLSPGAIVPQWAGSGVTALGLSRFNPLITVAVASTICILTDHYSPLKASCACT